MRGIGRYTDYLLDALKKRELFEHIRLSPLRFWCALLDCSFDDIFIALTEQAPVISFVQEQS